MWPQSWCLWVKSMKYTWSHGFIVLTWKMKNQQSRGRWNRDKPGARFGFVSLGSVSCLPAAHFLSVHHGVAGIGYDTWPPRRHRGSHLQGLLCFVSDTFCAWRHACYLSNRPGWALGLSSVCSLRVIGEARFLLTNSSINNVQSLTCYLQFRIAGIPFQRCVCITVASTFHLLLYLLDQLLLLLLWRCTASCSGQGYFLSSEFA